MGAALDTGVVVVVAERLAGAGCAVFAEGVRVRALAGADLAGVGWTRAEAEGRGSWIAWAAASPVSSSSGSEIFSASTK
jgi:hypothetical protein